MNIFRIICVCICILPIVSAEILNAKVNVETVNNTVTIYTDDEEKQVFDCDRDRERIIILEVRTETDEDLINKEVDDCESDKELLEKEIEELEVNIIDLDKRLLKKDLEVEHCVSSDIIEDSCDKRIDELKDSHNKANGILEDDVKLRGNIIIVLVILVVILGLALLVKRK